MLKSKLNTNFCQTKCKRFIRIQIFAPPGRRRPAVKASRSPAGGGEESGAKAASARRRGEPVASRGGGEESQATVVSARHGGEPVANRGGGRKSGARMVSTRTRSAGDVRRFRWTIT